MSGLVFLFFALASLACFFGSLVWIFLDAKARGRPALLVTLLAAIIAWPVSLLVWIALRPPLVQPNRRRPFNPQDHRRQ